MLNQYFYSASKIFNGLVIPNLESVYCTFIKFLFNKFHEFNINNSIFIYLHTAQPNKNENFLNHFFVLFLQYQILCLFVYFSLQN